MIKIGIIGNGKSANRYHLPYIFERSNRFEVLKIYDAHMDTPKFERINKIVYTEDIQDILTDPDINLVVICRINNHFEYAKSILDHGKHCLIEKPFMNSVSEAEEIFQYAASKSLLVQCFQNRRFDSDFLTAKKIIHSGLLGEIKEIEVCTDYFRPEIPKRVTKTDKRTSILFGHGSHTVDQIISLFGNPDRVVYDVRSLLGNNHMNDYYDLDLWYGLMKVSIKASYFRIKNRPTFQIYGTKGCFVKQTPDRQEEHLKLFYLPGKEEFGKDNPEHFGIITYMDDEALYHEEKVPSETGNYGRIYDNIYDQLVNNATKYIKDDETLEVMRILENGWKGLMEDE